MSAVDRAALEPELAMAWGRPEQAARIHASDLEALLAAARERDRLRRTLQDVRHRLDRAHGKDIVGWQRLALELSEAITAVIGTGAVEAGHD